MRYSYNQLLGKAIINTLSSSFLHPNLIVLLCALGMIFWAIILEFISLTGFDVIQKVIELQTVPPDPPYFPPLFLHHVL